MGKIAIIAKNSGMQNLEMQDSCIWFSTIKKITRG